MALDLSQSIFILKIFVVEDIFIWPIHRVFHVYHCSFYLVTLFCLSCFELCCRPSSSPLLTCFFMRGYYLFYLFNYMLTSFWLEHKPVFDKNICLFTRISRLLDKYNIKLVSESDKTNCFDSELFGLVFLWKIC